MDTGFFIFQIIVLIGSVVIHEVSHGLAAERLGDDTARRAGRLSLNPLKHLDPVGSFVVPGFLALLGGPIFGWARPVPYDPRKLKSGRRGEALVAAAGPASNIALALIFALIIRALSAWAPAFPEMLSFAVMLIAVVAVNLALAIFNLIPIPPLDGSKLLFAALPDSAQSIRIAIERYGFIILLAFVAFGWNIIGPAVSWTLRFLIGM